MKLAWANTDKFEDADVIVIGVPDESGSRAKIKGASAAPNTIRRLSNKFEVFQWKGGPRRVTQAETGIIKQKILDYGNVKKKDITKLIEKIVKQNKIPVTLGGDHSITTQILKGINKVKKNISLVYFDAHPDFRCKKGEYYGSVMCDISKLKNFNVKSSVEVGIRAPEVEEIENIRSKYLRTITPFDIAEKGLKKIFEEIKKKISKNIYLSIDIDVLDPAFAPGVSTPVPGGLSANQLFYLTKKLAALRIIGVDIMEVNPKRDIQNRTSHLAARLIAEIIASIKL